MNWGHGYFGAWLELMPKQLSTGDRTILGSISKRGNRYLRSLSHHTGYPARSPSRRKCDRFLVALAFSHHGPSHPCDLVGERDGSDLRWPPRQQCPEPGPMLGAMDLGIADNGERTGHKQAAQIAVTLLADTSKPVLSATGVLLRHDPDPGREIPPRSESLWVGNGSGQSRGQDRANARTIIQPQAHLIGSVPGSDHAVEL